MVKDEADNPAINALVEISSDSKSIWKGTQTDQDGRYSIEGLDPALDYVLSASEPGNSVFYYHSNGSVKSTERAERIQLGSGEEKQGYQIQLREGELIAGVIRDSMGRGISGIFVDAYSDFHDSGNSTISVQGGRYNIVGLTAGNDYEVSVIPTARQSYIPEFRSNVSTGSTGVDFILREGFSLQGVVSSQADGKPIKNVLVELLSDQEYFYDRIKTTRFGEYIIEGIPESDDYVIMVTPPENNSGTSFMSQTAYNQLINKNTYFNISLIPAEKIYGYVFNENNERISAVKVSAFSDSQNCFKTTHTDQLGYYELTPVPHAQDYILTATPKESSGFSEIKKYGISSGQQIDFTMNIGGSISGNVSGENGNIEGTHVIISSAILRLSRSIKTDSKGNYKFDSLPGTKNGIVVSDYKVTVNASGYPKAVKYNKTVGDVVDFRLKRDELNVLDGTVNDKNGVLLPVSFSKNVSIYVYDENGRKQLKFVAVPKDGTGAFRISGLTPNTNYKLYFVVGNLEHYESQTYDTSMIADFSFTNYSWTE
ncbi:MAG: hypothetical protein OMM_05236 [Candidatus Magnetoglobus multicellularis str. Araruama]|uniref:Uncharacterized protein n=1 Tax=Candidatus Magnetoglobus multicellularis str. Araruama TaxID=890399 RepID=A0A1V1NXL4_9BACT|nr:MAG: hypothetical protein OMM_05236 [Candidatus Magnetoglobus multicellularis str. Araruama]